MAVNEMLSVVRFDHSSGDKQTRENLYPKNKLVNMEKKTEKKIVSLTFMAAFLACFLNKKHIRPVYWSLSTNGHL